MVPRSFGRRVGSVAVTILTLLFGTIAVTQWAPSLKQELTVDQSGPSREATEWLIMNVPHDDVVIVDDYIWTDLAKAGFTNQVWFWKVDPDPAIVKKYFPTGYTGADYIATGELAQSTLSTLPTVAEAIRNSTIVATFGNDEVIIRRVTK